MEKSPKLSDVTDRANCSTEKTEKRRRRSRGQSKLLCKGSEGRGRRRSRGGGGAVGKRNDGKRGV